MMIYHKICRHEISLMYQTPKFFLQPNVFVCTTSEGCIFLDEERDRYLGLSAAKAHALSNLLDGLPQLYFSADPIDTNDAIDIANQLVAKGLLTQVQSVGKSAVPVKVKHVDEEIEWGSPRPQVRLHHIINFFVAVLLTATALRQHSHAQIMNVLRRRKACCNNKTNLYAARELAYVFRLLRPFGYTVKDRCLFDSLTLMRFMLHYNISPTLVFGVQIVPFFAHSWVQVETLVLNCSVEYARAFTPIRVI
jgi:hypothetical protein